MAKEPEAKPPITDELAPAIDSMLVATDPYLRVMANPDTVLSARGQGDLTLYKEVMRDDTVKSTFQQRRLSVIASSWDVEPGANDAQSKAAAEALKANLQAINFDAITDQMLYGVFYGYAVAEVMWGVNDGLITIDAVKVRDRDRFRFTYLGELFLKRDTGIMELMPDRKFWTLSTGADHSDNFYGTGLAHWLYWPVYFKRSDIKFWLIFLEKFGMPTAVGKLPSGKAADPQERTKLLQALRAISTETAVVMPDGAEIEFLEAARAGAASYEAMKSAMDQAIAKIVLSQVMTSEAVGGQYKAEVQGGILDKVVKSDADLICESFNRSVARWFTEYNFPGATPPRVWRQTEPPEDLSKRAERDSKIYALGYEPTEDYIKATYGEGWVKRQAAAPAEGALGANPFGNPGDDEAPGFSEGGSIAARRLVNQRGIDIIERGAVDMAGQWRRIIGPRVQRLLGMLEETGDLVTFRERLTDLFEEAPAGSTVDAIAQANFVASLVGRFIAQKDQPAGIADGTSEAQS